jgi:hypothetical protein
MIKFELLKDVGVLVVEPKDALTADDFYAISQTVDPYIRENGKVIGLLIEAPSFSRMGKLRCTRRAHKICS